jgi:two-component system cell cycle sensor histidine kinase/response regulator CckA
VAVNEAIVDLLALLRRLLGGRIRLETDLAEPGPVVRADPTQLDQVLLNLAVNARDAMPEGGALTLRSGHVTLYRPLTRGAETIPPGAYAMIEVQDTGTGIAPDILPRIFEPFFTTRREQGGSGLGLSTVHGIVRQSDGFVAVDSTPGQGTSMRIYLPRVATAEAPRPPPPPGRAPPPPPAGDRPVLLVDDEPAVLHLAGRALMRRGWRVLTADSAEAALAHLDDPAILAGLAVVVSDVVMPGLDGPALVRALRQRRPDVPAILCSGYMDAALRGDWAREGIRALPKPYTLLALQTMVEEVATAPSPA